VIDIADPSLGATERDAVEAVLDSGQLAAGSEVEAFEDAFAERCEADAAVAMANGTAALHAVFESLDLPDDATVVTTPFTFVASANAVRLAGYEPVFADVDPATYNLDSDAVAAVLDERDDVGAILAVHLYGLPADVAALRRVADEHDVALVEDAAQAHGARAAGEPVGAYGDAATFSFYPTKNMTTGEGGMVITDDGALESRVRSFINHGRTTDGGTYEHAAVGHNLRMTDLAAAIGRVQLDKLDEYTAARRERARVYDDAFADADLVTPVEPADRRHVYHQYTVRTEHRDALADHLAARDVSTAVYYPALVSEQPCYEDVGGGSSTPVAADLTDTVLSLPVHPNLGMEDVERVVDAVHSFDGGRR